jgi:bifunctional N-acetylglucosamine-1-phosphate-uridyltransferase/glucosamine-1-phosphate-acetyltransferase GlmU-like protein
MPHSVSLLILAAGLGSRFGSDKQILKVSSLQLPILAFSLQDAVKNNIAHAVIVTRSELADFFKKNIFPHFPSIHFDLVFQDQAMPKLPANRTKPWGTGHAVLCAQECIQGNFIVVNADDFYGPHAIASTVHFLENNHSNQFCCVGYPLIHTLSPNGPVSRGIIQTDSSNYVTSISEITQIQQQSNGSIFSPHTTKGSNHFPLLLEPQQPVSLNLFGLNANIFPLLEQKFQNFLQQNENFLTAEFYLPTALTTPDILNKTITMKMLPTQDRWLGITYRNDLPFVEDHLNQLIAKGLYS